MILHLLVFSVIIIITPPSSTSAEANCSRVCTGGGGGLGTPVLYPFGFTDGCEISLNCSEAGEILVGEYNVQNLTRDHILINFPAKCDRQFEEIRLFTNANFALTSRNSLLMEDCSSVLNDCMIPISMFKNDFNIRQCNSTGNRSMNCYSVDDSYREEFMNLKILESAGCQVLFSSIISDLNINGTESPGVSLNSQSLELGWWVHGECGCDQNAGCVDVLLENKRLGYRCHCNEGYDGDGFISGDGCRSGKKSNTARTVYVVVPVTCVSLGLIGIGVWFILTKTQRKHGASKKETNNFSSLLRGLKQTSTNGTHGMEITTVQSLQHDLGTIEGATNYFSPQNTIGKGGFGLVYKGVLPKGQEVAVKRLSVTSGQGVEEFVNEAVLVAKLQHRNLVKLLGFCHEAKEKILIYEYVPNKSLDYFLFDPVKHGHLDWATRWKIIGGITRGMLYLHEDSRLRIIHRDLKASNILLDQDMNAKISDFGLARIFGVDQTLGNTNKIAGTLGYMSPEYAMYGHFSVKSDVYGFGVIVLEIVSGQRNSTFYRTDDVEGLLTFAWKQWTSGRPLELLDPTLGESYSKNEVIRCINIGLLCVQEDTDARPSMASILNMLNNNSITLPAPKKTPCVLSKGLLLDISGDADKSIRTGTCKYQ